MLFESAECKFKPVRPRSGIVEDHSHLSEEAEDYV